MTHGEIWWVDFGVPIGSLPGYRRPAIIVQNDAQCNSDLNTVVVVPLTTNLPAADYEPNILLAKEDTKLAKDSVAVIHLIGAVNKFCLIEKVSKISDKTYKELQSSILKFTNN